MRFSFRPILKGTFLDLLFVYLGRKLLFFVEFLVGSSKGANPCKSFGKLRWFFGDAWGPANLAPHKAKLEIRYREERTKTVT